MKTSTNKSNSKHNHRIAAAWAKPKATVDRSVIEAQCREARVLLWKCELTDEWGKWIPQASHAG